MSKSWCRSFREPDLRNRRTHRDLAYSGGTVQQQLKSVFAVHSTCLAPSRSIDHTVLDPHNEVDLSCFDLSHIPQIWQT
jgi:hypothetical protein